MREIKFRAWDGAKMAQRATLCVDSTDGALLDVEIDDYRQWPLMQFTGLKDKNGKEIYEGDIMKTSDTGNLFEVIFDDKAASFKIIERSNTYAKNRRWMMGWDVKRRAVIGNIYQNPELLNP